MNKEILPKNTCLASEANNKKSNLVKKSIFEKAKIIKYRINRIKTSSLNERHHGSVSMAQREKID